MNEKDKFQMMIVVQNENIALKNERETLLEQNNALKQLVLKYQCLLKDLVNQRTDEWQANLRELYQQTKDLLGEDMQ